MSAEPQNLFRILPFSSTLLFANCAFTHVGPGLVLGTISCSRARRSLGKKSRSQKTYEPAVLGWLAGPFFKFNLLELEEQK